MTLANVIHVAFFLFIHNSIFPVYSQICSKKGLNKAETLAMKLHATNKFLELNLNFEFTKLRTMARV